MRPVSVGATIHRHNAAEVEAIAELAASKGAERLYIGPMYPAGRATALNDLVVSGEQWDLAVDQYVNVVKTGVIAPLVLATPTNLSSPSSTND